jgi:hypothetical protein
MAITVYRGSCDASAAVRIGAGSQFVTASDEDYILRLYDSRQPGLPSFSLDLTTFLEPDDSTKEPDIEGAARIGNRVYWITSHGRDKDGVEQESRQRFFATSIAFKEGQLRIEPAGRPYKRLLGDLVNASRVAGCDFKNASTRAPEAPGGLNLEGLAPTPEGHLLIGFRNPVPQGRALVMRLHNSSDLVGERAHSATLTLAAQLDLGGRGIRALEFIPESRTYVVMAGSFDDTRDFRLYTWSGALGDAPVPMITDALADINPEELVVTSITGAVCHLEVFSDDGDLLMCGKKPQKVKDKTLRSFRSVTFQIELPSPPSGKCSSPRC